MSISISKPRLHSLAIMFYIFFMYFFFMNVLIRGPTLSYVFSFETHKIEISQQSCMLFRLPIISTYIVAGNLTVFRGSK
ncbi:hypothetical protein XELAEV_18006716mg [Xenopus laevis]|uniref:Uncharacterized protein n=1 Tax=Xenopus laevis TaxID=8355 RepID=A0A974I4N3_XENLA|nr:hypothetical protein XELAEV_18006716mg [Xenopus laevis]